MFDLDKFLLEKITLRHIWFFITGKCGLNCDYCFFSERRHGETLSFPRIKSLLKLLPRNRKYDFVISGGEPAICWNLTHNIIALLKDFFPLSAITLQTNTLFLNANKIRFLKENDLLIGLSWDGDFLANRRHRIGITASRYKKCLENISLIVNAKLRMNPTMTVHPQEAGSVSYNFKELLSLGLRSIDVHPAFMSNWNTDKADKFAKEYKKILFLEYDFGQHLVCKGYSIPIRPSFDLVIQPDGFVLPNWTFLAFPHRFREKFFIMRLLENNVVVLKENFLKFFREIESFFSLERSYRDFSNFSASLILKQIKDNRLTKKFLIYESLCNRLQRLDRLFLAKKDMYR